MINEYIAVYIIVYTLVMTVFGIAATFFVQTDTIGMVELLFGEGNSKDAALRKLSMITNSHFGLLVITVTTLLYWEGYV